MCRDNYFFGGSGWIGLGSYEYVSIFCGGGGGVWVGGLVGACCGDGLSSVFIVNPFKTCYNDF